jgi:hypothetical protein
MENMHGRGWLKYKEPAGSFDIVQDYCGLPPIYLRTLRFAGSNNPNKKGTKLSDVPFLLLD